MRRQRSLPYSQVKQIGHNPAYGSTLETFSQFNENRSMVQELFDEWQQSASEDEEPYAM